MYQYWSNSFIHSNLSFTEEMYAGSDAMSVDDAGSSDAMSDEDWEPLVLKTERPYCWSRINSKCYEWWRLRAMSDEDWEPLVMKTESPYCWSSINSKCK